MKQEQALHLPFPLQLIQQPKQPLLLSKNLLLKLLLEIILLIRLLDHTLQLL